MDKIVYIVWTSGGGVDGMDRSDKSKPRFASFDKQVAESELGHWDRKELEKAVIDVEAARKEALAKLGPVDRLVLGLNPEKK